MKPKLSLFILFLLFSTECFAVACFGVFAKNQMRHKLERIVRQHLGSYPQEFGGIHKPDHLPVEVLREWEDGDSIFISMSFDIPFLLKIPAKSESIYEQLSVEERRELAKMVAEIYSQNKYSKKFSDEAAVNIFSSPLGLNAQELSHAFEGSFESYYKSLGVKFPNLQAIWEIANGKYVDSTIIAKKRLFEEVGMENLKKMKLIDSKALFSLALMQKNCVGVCRHAADQMVFSLLELGFPAQDVFLHWGFSSIPVTGHTWVSVNKTSYDPNPRESTKVYPKFYRLLYPIGGSRTAFDLFNFN